MDENSYIVERDRIIAEINETFSGVRLGEGIGFYEAQTDTWSLDTKAVSKARNIDRQ